MEIPPTPFLVEAIADFNPEMANQMALACGKIYEVVALDDTENWAQSNENGIYKWFPFNFTKVVSNSTLQNELKREGTATSMNSRAASSLSVGATYRPIVKTEEFRSKPLSTKKHILNLKSGDGLKKSTVLLQICEAYLSPPPNEFCKKAKDMDTTVRVSVKLNNGKDDEKRCAYTESRKKTHEPSWNEEFLITIFDPDIENLSMKVFHGKDKKKLYGELELCLRGSERDYDYPYSKYAWYFLKKRDKSGNLSIASDNKIMIFVQYKDSLNINRPTGFRRLGHIGMDEHGNFDLENLPPEWIEKFKELGIRKKHLKDASFAKDVFDIMKNATEAETLETSILLPEQTESQALPAPPILVSEAVQELPQQQDLSPPVLESQRSVDLGLVQQIVNQDEIESTIPAVNEVRAPPPSPEEGNDLLSLIRKGKALKSVENRILPERRLKEESFASNNVTELLKKAMKDRLSAVAGESESEEDDDDDWD